MRDHVLAKFAAGEWAGETAQLLTERTGGSDLGALETTATRVGDAWLLNGFKWFASNCAVSPAHSPAANLARTWSRTSAGA
ncbi:acyl-CoA dehydrogenase family protein [Mycobacterium sp. E2462]|uniref:acyl-CoA dehydrogenase family protein n=1 Tax=Mycobacterium sp. E2462 TaxID=1834133 RepID=UPI0035136D54